MISRAAPIFAVALAACVAGQATSGARAAPCEPGDQVLERSVLYLGRNIPGGDTVSDEDWRRFADSVVTPRFPDGLSVVGAAGQWRGRSGVVEREHTMLLIVLHQPDATSRMAVQEIADAYRRQFRQESVLRERSRVCARFSSQ